MTLPTLLAHVAARWAATRTPAHGWVPDESEIEMNETTTIKPGQTWRNHLDVELHIVSNAAECFRTLASDIWVAERRDPLFGKKQYIVTAAALAEAGYKQRHEQEEA